MQRTKFAVILGAFFLAGVLTSEGLRWLHTPTKKPKPKSVANAPVTVVEVRERRKFSAPKLRDNGVSQRLLDEHAERMTAPAVVVDLSGWEARRMDAAATSHKEVFLNHALTELHLRMTALEGWAAEQ